MKKVYIIALHLAFGGIEKAVCSMANLFADKYDVRIVAVYNMPDSPAFPLDERVKVCYLLEDTPNREEWKSALKGLRPAVLARESARSLRILREKKQCVIGAIRSIDRGVVITTRHEDNLLLSQYGSPQVLKIAQIHQDHKFEKTFVDGFKNGYGNIDVLTMLTPGLAEEARELMYGCNSHTRVEYVPNFLEHYPESVWLDGRDKTVLAVGRLNAVKRFELLIESFAAVHAQAPDWQLRIVGEGEERGKLQKLIAKLSAESYVTLVGRLDSAGVEREMLRASFFAMSSASEGFPFVLLEAQSCGLPVLAYDVRVGPGFVVKNGLNGYLVGNLDRDMFCRRLLELMGSPELRRGMGENALKRVGDFSRERVRDIWYSIIGD